MILASPSIPIVWPCFTPLAPEQLFFLPQIDRRYRLALQFLNGYKPNFALASANLKMTLSRHAHREWLDQLAILVRFPISHREFGPLQDGFPSDAS